MDGNFNHNSILASSDVCTFSNRGLILIQVNAVSDLTTGNMNSCNFIKHGNE